MEFGAIIKRAWQITWKYKALWVLGIFAGVSGCQPGSGGGGGGGGGGGQGGTGAPGDFGDFGQFAQVFERLIPVLFAVGAIFFVIGLVWFLLSVAARGGLVTAVNQIEDGGSPRLGDLWRAGFARFWSLLGLQIVVSLPLLLLGLILLVAVVIPILGPLMAGEEPTGAAFAPVIGGLCLGLPVLIVLSLILGVLYLIALRYLMLGGQGAIQSLGSAWKFFRVRFKDTFLMYLISGALNLAASFVLVIPIAVLAAAIAVPAIMSGSSDNWGAVWGLVAVGAVAIIAISILYNGIWGTFTSALWTLFFRRVLGVQQPVTQPAPAYPTQPYGAEMPPLPPSDMPSSPQPPTDVPPPPPPPAPNEPPHP